MKGKMNSALQIAIQAYQELRGRSLDEKPEGASEEWWKSYVEARDSATPDAPRGERGVTLVEPKAAEGESGIEAKAQADGEVTIKIYGFIERWTLVDFDYYLEQAGSRKVRVRIASPGGDAGVGLQIYTMIRKRGNVVTEADGPIASAASVIFLAGQERLIPEEAASVMVHRSWLLACQAGNVIAWRKLLEKIESVLSIIDDGMAAVLKARIGGTKEEAMEYLDAETYFTPEQCVENGIATGYCEYADEGEVDPQDGDQAGEQPEEEMASQDRAPGSAEQEESKASAPLFEGEAAEAGEKAGGDHGNKPRKEEAAGEYPDKDKKSEEASEEKASEEASEESAEVTAAESEASGEEAEGASSEKGSGDGAEGEAESSEPASEESAEASVVQSEREATHPYPTWLREEL